VIAPAADALGFVESSAPTVALLAAAVVVPRSLLRRRALTWILSCVAVAVVTDGLAAFGVVPALLAYALVTLYCLGVIVAANAVRQRVERDWLAEARVPLALDPPFAGEWRVVAGGPNPGRNHHLIASDQRFAYDFISTEGPSAGADILAPVSGTVVVAHDGEDDHPPSMRVVEDPRPLGNHVAIETPGGVVFLCHLKRGSVAVRVGEFVASGAIVGRCGNSGRTTRPHLHIHAQDLPVYAFNRAAGIPIAFGGVVLRAGDLCEGRSSV
jgi:murein DD-endopeptidase MepM/ murein hydrolase activator NlpD